MQPVLYYCYDAYCGWCYGFSIVIKKIAEEYEDLFHTEVLSGGIIPLESAKPISVVANYVKQEYTRVQELTGITFGEDYLWHINNPGQSDWIQHSEKSAIALCIFKELFPDLQTPIAAELQYALHFEGRDLTDDQAYHHILEKYGINAEEFYSKLHSQEYKEKAHYEFALCRQLHITGFPALLIQVSESKFYLIAKGYTDYEEVKSRIEKVLKEINFHG
jgi:putative protein-disulfide isomerase